MHNSWFRLSNRITEDHEFFSFDDSEFKVWIYLLCLASQKNTDVVRVVYQHADHVCRLKRATINSAINKLVKIRCLEPIRTRTIRGRYAEDTRAGATEQDITNRTEQNSIAQPNVERDFDLLYRRYPRKQGKAVGLRKLKATVKTQVDWIELNTALDNFLDHHKRAGTEAQFIPHFSTWTTSWRDWLDPDAGRSESFQGSNKPLAEIDLDGGAA